MLLTIDIGNTAIKSALFDGDNILQFNRYSETDELFSSVLSKEIDSVAFTSVVPSKSKLLCDFFTKNKNITSFQIKSNSIFNLKIRYN